MEDTSTGAPATSGGEASAPSPSSDATSQASASTGIAPGGSGDAVAAGEATGSAASSPAAQFSFLNRRFPDQQTAEKAFRSEFGMLPGVQRKLAESERKIQALESALAMREAGVSIGQGQGQNAPRGQESAGESKSFAQELAESKDLQLIAEMAEDPKIGLAGALYHMADLMDNRHQKQLDGLRSEFTGEFQQQSLRQQQHQAVAKSFGIVKSLATEYPELDESNQSDEAYEAQQAVLETLEAQFTPEQLASNLDFCVRSAADHVRRTRGTPIFAQPPGTSGSPAGRAAQAAEAQALTTAAAPLDGSGVPRQRANGQPESPVERIKRENREISTRVARTPSGRPLGFDLPS